MVDDAQTEDEKLAEDKQEALIVKRHLKALTASEGWKIVRRVLEARVQERVDAIVLKPPSERPAVGDEEFMRGEAAMAKFVVALVDTEIELNDAIIGALKDD